MRGLNREDVFKVVRNFFLGLALLPAIISVTLLYMPYIFGVDMITGTEVSVSEILKEGYVITKEDVDAIKHFENVLKDTAFYGLLLGFFFAFAEVISALLGKRKSGEKGVNEK